MINYNKADLLDHKAIGAVIKDNKGRILVQKHVKFGFWTIPIGKVESDQSLEEGLKQELFEECGIKIEIFEEIGKRIDDYIRNDRKVNVEAYLFEIKKYSGEIENKEPHKHSEQFFMSIEELKEKEDLSDMALLYLEISGKFNRSKT